MAAGGAGVGGASPSLLELFTYADQTIRANALSHSFGDAVLPEIRRKYPRLLPMVGERAKKEGHPSCKEKDIGKHKTPVFIGVSCFARVEHGNSKPLNSVWVEIPSDAGEHCCVVESRDKALRYGLDGYVCFLEDTRLVLSKGRTHECAEKSGIMWHYGDVVSETGGTVRLQIENKHLFLDEQLSRDALVTSDNEAGAGAGKATKATKATKPKTPRGGAGGAGGAGAGPPLPRKRTRTRRQKHRTRRRRN